MSETENKGEEKTPTGVKVVIEKGKEVEALEREIKRIEEEKRKESEELAKEAKKVEDLEAQIEALKTEKDDYKSQVELIAEKEFNKKMEIVLEEAKKFFPEDSKQFKEMKTKLEDKEKGPANLVMAEFLLNQLHDAVEKGKKEDEETVEKRQKELEEKARLEKETGKKQPPEAKEGEQKTGSGVPLTGAQTGEEENSDSWDSHMAMIRDLRTRARDPSDPVKQAEAQQILDSLWNKWAKHVKKDFESSGKVPEGYTPKEVKTGKQMQKEGA